LQPGLAPATAGAIAKIAAPSAIDVLALTANLVSRLVEEAHEALLHGLADDHHVIALDRSRPRRAS